MDNKVKKLFMWNILLIFVLFITACTNEGGTDPSNENDQVNNSVNNNEPNNESENENGMNDIDTEPVTLKVVVGWDEEMFNHRFKNPIETEFPWITLEQIQSGSGREELEEIFADGTSPDIFFEVSPDNMEYFGLDYDLDEMIEKTQYDVSHIDPAYLDAIRAKDYKHERRLLGIPYEIVNWVLFYNKDIFDSFGQEYPTNDMTWDDAIELAKNLTGEREGVHYRGLDLGPAQVPLLQFSSNKTDPETGEVLIEDDPVFAKYLDLLNQIASLDPTDEPFFDPNKFVEQRATAMFVEFVQAVDWWSDAEGLNFDVAPLPTWANEPAVSHRPDEGILHLSISPHSENIEAAFKVLTHFTEKEYQIFASRIGLGPTSIEKDVLSQFFQDYESTHDKNMESIFTHPPQAPPEQISRWDAYVDFNVHRYMNDEEFSHLDRNEYLRIVAEESEAKIKNAMESN